MQPSDGRAASVSVLVVMASLTPTTLPNMHQRRLTIGTLWKNIIFDNWTLFFPRIVGRWEGCAGSQLDHGTKNHPGRLR